MKRLISKHSAATLAAVIALTAIGGWLTGMFQASDESHEVTGADLVTASIGFVLFVGGLAGIVLLVRQNMRPWSDEQVLEWKRVRTQGRKVYLQDAVLKGFLLALFAIAGFSIIDYWKSRSLQTILDSLWIYAALFFIFVFGLFYAALRSWNANEQHYRSRIQSGDPEHS